MSNIVIGDPQKEEICLEGQKGLKAIFCANVRNDGQDKGWNFCLQKVQYGIQQMQTFHCSKWIFHKNRDINYCVFA